MQHIQFNNSVFHTPVKNLVIADTLSRSPVGTPNQGYYIVTQEVDMFVNHVVTHLPISNWRLGEIEDDLEQDTVCNKI